MHEKRSAVILKELVEVTGGDPWGQLKLEATAAGLQVPLVAGEENEDRVVERPTRIPLPSSTAFQTIQKMNKPYIQKRSENRFLYPPSPKSKAGARVLSL